MGVKKGKGGFKMKYLIIQGSSIHKLFVRCSDCGKQATWLRAYMIDTGVYEAICAKCKLLRLM